MKQRRRLVGVAIVLVALIASGGTYNAQEKEKGGTDRSGPYEPAIGWPTFPGTAEWTWGKVAGIWADTPDRIFIFQQGELPFIKQPVLSETAFVPARAANSAKGYRWQRVLSIYNRAGQLVESWDQHKDLFVHPHRVRVDPYDPQRPVWGLDDHAYVMHKFTADGKLLMTLGEFKVNNLSKSKAFDPKKHLYGPTDIAFLPNGDFYVTDGHQAKGAARVVKFSKDGTYLTEFGKGGVGPGEFDSPHAIAIDARQRIYVADRNNSRVQVFDLAGKHLETWPNILFPCSIDVSRDQSIWVSDCGENKFLKYNANGKLLYSWGTFGGRPGQMWGPIHFSVDSEGNLYVAEAFMGRPQKFVPKKGADPSKLVGPPYPWFSRK